jgi:hypothetical protein
VKIKIVSNGKPIGTHVYDLETGKEIPGITGIRMEASVGSMMLVQLNVIPEVFEYEGPAEAVERGITELGESPTQDESTGATAGEIQKLFFNPLAKEQVEPVICKAVAEAINGKMSWGKVKQIIENVRVARQ